VAAFPSAHYVIQAAEWAFATAPGKWSFLFRPDDFVPLAASGHLRLIDGAFDVTSEVRCVPRPGHTPGHQVVEVVSRGEMAILVGDAIQSDAQIRDAGTESAQDVDSSQAAATRVALIRRAAERGASLGMAHAGEGIRHFALLGCEEAAAGA
jgi:glyoxylase-like metal-dependent hydrolase (beta-lactamase superfamily II)